MPTTLLTHGRVTWTNIVQPVQADIDQLSARYPQFHPLNLKDSLTTTEIPKLDHHDDYLFLVVHLPAYDKTGHLYRAEEVDIFIAKSTLVTIHTGRLQALNELFRSAQQDQHVRESLMGRGASPLLYELLDRFVEYGMPLSQRFDRDIQHIEKGLFTSDTRHILNEIAVVRRDLIALRHIIKPQLPVIRALAKGNWPWIHEDLTLYWSDISDRITQFQARLDEHIDVVSGLSETIDTLASHRIDEVVRVLTIFTVLTLPLSLLSTIFGMNVVLPYKDHPIVFFAIVGFGVVLTTALLWYLRSRKWL
ncbi:MAG TPA: magnesium transporter CorA family protein [Anaerolineales bacterium]|nr:magnesium transporter CorA family protein [Anaerolineales bacterium]